MFKYIRNFVFVFKLIYRSLHMTYVKMNDPEIREFAKFRHILIVAEKVKDHPQVAIAMHATGYENIPTLEDAFQLRDEVLSDEDLCEHCGFEKNVTHHDLIVILLGGYSEAMISGMLGEEDEDVDG